MCNVRDGSSLRASPEHRSRTQDRIGWQEDVVVKKETSSGGESHSSSSSSEAIDVEEKESGAASDQIDQHSTLTSKR